MTDKYLRVTAPYVTLRVNDQNGNTVLLGFYDGAVLKNPVEDVVLDKHLRQGLVAWVEDDDAAALRRAEADDAKAKEAARAAGLDARAADLQRERDEADAAREAAGAPAEPGDGYDDLTAADLRDQLAGRNLSTSGNKPDLVARLRAADAG